MYSTSALAPKMSMRQRCHKKHGKACSFAAGICGQWEPRPAPTSNFGKGRTLSTGPGHTRTLKSCSAASGCGGSSTLATTLGASLSAFRAPYSNQLSRSITTASRPSGLASLQPRASRRSFASTTRGKPRACTPFMCGVGLGHKRGGVGRVDIVATNVVVTAGLASSESLVVSLGRPCYFVVIGKHAIEPIWDFQ